MEPQRKGGRGKGRRWKKKGDEGVTRSLPKEEMKSVKFMMDQGEEGRGSGGKERRGSGGGEVREGRRGSAGSEAAIGKMKLQRSLSLSPLPPQKKGKQAKEGGPIMERNTRLLEVARSKRTSRSPLVDSHQKALDTSHIRSSRSPVWQAGWGTHSSQGEKNKLKKGMETAGKTRRKSLNNENKLTVKTLRSSKTDDEEETSEGGHISNNILNIKLPEITINDVFDKAEEPKVVAPLDITKALQTLDRKEKLQVTDNVCFQKLQSLGAKKKEVLRVFR